MFRRKALEPGLYTGMVTSRTTGEPTREVSYSIVIKTSDGDYKFDGVVPQENGRWTSFDETQLIIPFEVTQYVTVHIVAPGSSGLKAIIGQSELPYHGPCQTGGTP